MNIKKVEKARELLNERDALEKAIKYTSNEFRIEVKVEAEYPWKNWIQPYLKTFVKDELVSMLKARLKEVDKQLKRL